MNLYCRLKGKPPLCWTDETVTGALAGYISSPNADFQPMNANYGILRPLGEKRAGQGEKAAHVRGARYCVRGGTRRGCGPRGNKVYKEGKSYA